MASRIESLVEAQRRLLGDISHELRSPLARQGVALGLARRRAGTEATTALDRIEREASRLNEMIGQLLSLSRIETDADGSKKSKIDLTTLVQEIVEDGDFEARERDRRVRLISTEAVSLRAVPELLRSAIENVIRNAVRYTEANTEVEVSIASKLIANNRWAVITVRDHGHGVSNGQLTGIFQPFYRVEDDRDRRTGGSGLGLSIAARAIKLHGGTIEASNAPNGGLIVEIRLPTELDI